MQVSGHVRLGLVRVIARDPHGRVIVASDEIGRIEGHGDLLTRSPRDRARARREAQPLRRELGEERRHDAPGSLIVDERPVLPCIKQVVETGVCPKTRNLVVVVVGICREGLGDTGKILDDDQVVDGGIVGIEDSLHEAAVAGPARRLQDGSVGVSVAVRSEVPVYAE